MGTTEIWVCKDGRSVPIRDMADDHLRAVLRRFPTPESLAGCALPAVIHRVGRLDALDVCLEKVTSRADALWRALNTEATARGLATPEAT